MNENPDLIIIQIKMIYQAKRTGLPDWMPVLFYDISITLSL